MITMNASIEARHLPSREYISECFDYCQSSGVLTWKERPLHHFKNAHGMNTFNSKFAGKISGGLINGRYLAVPLDGRKYLAHRVIWKLMTGEDPNSNIDHIDTNKRNNAWLNLRKASKQENAFNQSRTKRNSTGFKGVSFDRQRGKYFACIRSNGKTKSLGRFDTAHEAHHAYVSAAKNLHGEFLRIE